MPEEHLRELLEELHSELEHSESVDEQTRELLRAARGDIEKALVSGQPDAGQQASTARSRIREAIERFGGEHPKGAALLNRVLDALSNVGI